MTTMTTIGFIGLGIMGKPMAGHLIKGGHRLFLHSRSGVPADLIELGGVQAGHLDINLHRAPRLRSEAG